MFKEEINIIFNSFNNLRVLIIGDVMVDAYMWGKVERISPEAPVPVVAVNKRENRLGGAANVALNIQSMGAIPIICSIIGNDEKGELFIELLKEQNITAQGIIKSKSRQTTVKTRIISSNHQLLRVDEEIETDISTTESKQLLNTVNDILNDQKIDVIIFEDYDKGLITPAFIDEVVSEANKRNIPVAVDPKEKNFTSYKNIALFKPNLKELKEGLKIDIDHRNINELKKVIDSLHSSQNINTILLTLSETGIYVSSDNIKEVVSAHLRDISDVSGAGDTVISVAALCLASGISPVQIAALSNLAGGLVCEKVGVVPIDKTRFLEETLLLFIQ
ncbi:MAG: bifunctional ADP-heptose synthase [Bacteroidota bacterium]